MVGVARLIRLRPSPGSLAAGLGLSAPAYHLTLTLGDWVTRTCSQEPLTMKGFSATLAASMPYIERSLLGDILLTGAFLGLYFFASSLVRQRWPSYVLSKT